MFLVLSYVFIYVQVMGRCDLQIKSLGPSFLSSFCCQAAQAAQYSSVATLSGHDFNKLVFIFIIVPCIRWMEWKHSHLCGMLPSPEDPGMERIKHFPLVLKTVTKITVFRRAYML